MAASVSVKTLLLHLVSVLLQNYLQALFITLKKKKKSFLIYISCTHAHATHKRNKKEKQINNSKLPAPKNCLKIKVMQAPTEVLKCQCSSGSSPVKNFLLKREINHYLRDRH